MFLIDDVLKNAITYFFKRVDAGRNKHDSAIKSIRVAMRALASSLAEITLQLEAGLHKMKKAVSNQDQFFSELERLVDGQFLRESCDEAGICKELRIAQDELFNISPVNTSPELDNVRYLASQLEAYETAFVSAIQEFLSHARGIDLTATNTSSDLPKPKPENVIIALQERIDGLNNVRSEIEKLLKRIRETALSR